MSGKRVFRVGKLSEKLEAAKVPLSPVVSANGFVFVSGQPPLDPATGELVGGDIEAQTRAALDNVRLCLETAGSSLDKVVKVNVYVANIAYYDRVNAVYAAYFPTDPPARTFAAVASWPWEFDIEIDCVALA